MIRSMTGYGRGENTLYDRKFTVEIKSVNHRYNDVNIKIPKLLNSFEEKIRKIVANYTNRGKTDVYVSFESFSKNDIKINFNKNLADIYVLEIDNIIKRYNFEKENMLNILLNFPDIITVENTSINNDVSNEIWETLNLALQEALEKFVQMRENEGLSLKNDMLSKVYEILRIVQDIDERQPIAFEEMSKKIKLRITEALKDIEIDDTRIFTEITILADKSCIDEELTRLFSHIKQFEEIVEEGGIVGRKLDFLIQEFNREANTIGSKSTDIEITKLVVNLKSEIEKIREQVQNIE